MLTKEQKIREAQFNLEDCFKEPQKDFDDGYVYQVYAFAVNDQHMFTYVVLFPEGNYEKGVLGGDGLISVYHVEDYYTNKFIDLNNKRDVLKTGGFATAPCRTKIGALIYIIYLPLNIPFATII